MARKNATVLPTDVQATLLGVPDFLRELMYTALQEVLESAMMWGQGVRFKSVSAHHRACRGAVPFEAAPP